MTLFDEKTKKSDRVLVLKVIDGKKPISSTGLVDPRLFTGGNKLHAVMDPQHMLWYFKYEQGGLPEVLKQKFTSFRMLKAHADDYFGKRNMVIEEVLD